MRTFEAMRRIYGMLLLVLCCSLASAIAGVKRVCECLLCVKTFFTKKVAHETCQRMKQIEIPIENKHTHTHSKDGEHVSVWQLLCKTLHI